jgi:hypothetical protein
LRDFKSRQKSGTRKKVQKNRLFSGDVPALIVFIKHRRSYQRAIKPGHPFQTKIQTASTVTEIAAICEL